MRIGLFGGSFDPIHFGHLISARSIAEQLSLDRVVLIPCGQPPHKRDRLLAQGRHRLEMARRAVDGEALFEVCDLEVTRSGPSFTIDTIVALKASSPPETDFFWLIGADSLPELPTWRRIDELVNLVRIITAVRPGWKPPNERQLAEAVGEDAAGQLLRDCFPSPMIEISSTDIRSRVSSNRSIRFLVPDEVRSYIQQQLLYCS